MLEPLAIRVPVAGATQITWFPEEEDEVHTRVVPSSLLRLDAITQQAITGGTCDLPWGKLPGALWIRLLRTVLDELGVGTTYAGDYRETLREIWSSVGLGYGHYLREWRSYERIEQKYQEFFMLMAAKVFTDAFERPAMRQRILEMAQSYQENKLRD
jgi:hypothetical protein